MKDTTYDEIVEFLDRVRSEAAKAMSQFYENPGGRVNWPVVKAARLKKIYRNSAKTGLVWDTKGLDDIAESILKGIARLQFSSEAQGHEAEDPRMVLEEYGFPEEVYGDETCMEKFWVFMGAYWGGSEFVSDSGLPRLKEVYPAILYAASPEEKLVAIDTALSLAHQRGDLAAMFVEGGSQTLEEIKEMEA